MYQICHESKPLTSSFLYFPFENNEAYNINSLACARVSVCACGVCVCVCVWVGVCGVCVCGGVGCVCGVCVCVYVLSTVPSNFMRAIRS